MAGEWLWPVSLWPLVKVSLDSDRRSPCLRPLVTHLFPGGRRHLSIHRRQSWRRRSDLNLIASTNFKSVAEITVLAVNFDHIQNIGRRKGSAIIRASVATEMDYCCYLSSIIRRDQPSVSPHVSTCS